MNRSERSSRLASLLTPGPNCRDGYSTPPSSKTSKHQASGKHQAPNFNRHPEVLRPRFWLPQAGPRPRKPRPIGAWDLELPRSFPEDWCLELDASALLDQYSVEPAGVSDAV